MPISYLSEDLRHLQARFEATLYSETDLEDADPKELQEKTAGLQNQNDLIKKHQMIGIDSALTKVRTDLADMQSLRKQREVELNAELKFMKEGTIGLEQDNGDLKAMQESLKLMIKNEERKATAQVETALLEKTELQGAAAVLQHEIDTYKLDRTKHANELNARKKKILEDIDGMKLLITELETQVDRNRVSTVGFKANTKLENFRLDNMREDFKKRREMQKVEFEDLKISTKSILPKEIEDLEKEIQELKEKGKKIDFDGEASTLKAKLTAEVKELKNKNKQGDDENEAMLTQLKLKLTKLQMKGQVKNLETQVSKFEKEGEMWQQNDKHVQLFTKKMREKEIFKTSP